jgi:hypothetical protein
VWARQVTYNNDESISGNSVKSAVKVAYYQLFALLYGFCGAFAGEPGPGAQGRWWARGRGWGPTGLGGARHALGARAGAEAPPGTHLAPTRLPRSPPHPPPAPVSLQTW